MEAYLETPSRIQYPIQQGESIVGRYQESSRADIQLKLEYGSEHTSREHCMFYNDGHQVMVTDLGSSNGTYVNGDKIEKGKEVPLEHGDRLTLGSFEIDFIDQEILDSKPKPKRGLLGFLFRRK